MNTHHQFLRRRRRRRRKGMVADDNNEAFNSMAPAGAVCDWSCENNLRLGMPTPVLLVYRNF